MRGLTEEKFNKKVILFDTVYNLSSQRRKSKSNYFCDLCSLKSMGMQIDGYEI